MREKTTRGSLQVKPTPARHRESMFRPLESYPSALLSLMDKREDVVQDLPLGVATRVGTQSSDFEVPAHRLLKAIIEHSPSPPSMANEFLTELRKCGITAVVAFVDSLGADHSVSPENWAQIVFLEIETHVGDFSHLTALASHYLSYLVIPFNNPGGKKTPQDSVRPSPHPNRTSEIAVLLQKANINRSQAALKSLVYRRDGPACLFSHLPFTGDGAVIPRCAHIIPFSVNSKTQTHSAVESFTGRILAAETVHTFINHPCNAMNLQNDVHDSINKFLAWGIEAVKDDHQWRYFFRVVRPAKVPLLVELEDGEEILFGQGEDGDDIDCPDPCMCNLHLAVARVSAASGAAEVFDKYLDDDDIDECHLPIYFGGPFVSDDVLMRRLEVLAN